MNTLRFKRLRADAVLPTQALDGSAGYDIATVDYAHLDPDEARTLSTGIAVEIPAGYVGLVFSRSGHGFKYDVSLANSVGVIDSNYRGEIKVRLRNDGYDSFIVEPGTKVCQMVVIPCLFLPTEWAEEMPASTRGENGFGSTG